MAEPSAGVGVLAGFDPLSQASMQDTYSVWLRNQFGANPLAMNYGQRQAPWAGLQYLSSPLAFPDPEVSQFGGFEQYEGISNPFQSWLREGVGALDTQNWMTRAQNVANALQGGSGLGARRGAVMSPNLRGQIQERFGAGEMQAGEAAEARARQLAFAPIVSGTSGALRGEVGNVLARMYQNWRVNQAGTEGIPAAFLKYAMQRGAEAVPADPSLTPEQGGAEGTPAVPQGLWQQFGLTPDRYIG
jgi:hypothetical protein